MTSPNFENPKVFISYSHDSEDHMERVLALSDRLRREGVDCHIDQYEESPGEGWPRWAIKQIEDADIVLLVCNETYSDRFKGKGGAGTGLGVKEEAAIIAQAFFDAEAENTKFIPVLFSPLDKPHIPTIVRGATRYDLSTEEGYEGLYRRLTNQPRVSKPVLGKLRPMPPLERKLTSPIPTQTLAGLLAELYETQSKSRRVVEGAGLDAVYVEFKDNAIDNWYYILAEAKKRGRVKALLQFVCEEYPERKKELTTLGDQGQADA